MAQPSDHSLPSIPFLPPLEMPDSSSHSIPSPRVTDFSSSLPQSSSASFASGESFATALTSTPPLATPIGGQIPELSLHTPTLAPPQNLRKSLSVDSFVGYGRDGSTKSDSRPNRFSPTSQFDQQKGLPLDDFAGRVKDEEKGAIPPIRNRGGSLIEPSSSGARIGDSDVERSDILNYSLDGDRTSSRDLPRSQIRAGELPLPRRLTVSSSSAASTSSTSSTLPQEPGHRIHTTSSMQSIPRRVASASMSSVPGRTRSGSLGMHATANAGRMLINTQISAVTDYTQNSEVTLAVVGSAGCGKSVVIRRGLKPYGLSEPSTFFAPSILPGLHVSIPYTRRVGEILQHENTPNCPLQVLEVETRTPENEAFNPMDASWPDGAPRVDGVLICYDASVEASFLPVEDLLKGYRALKLPTVVLACKSDLEKQVEPQTAVEVLRQYDVGLVEVTNTEDSGKTKMRRSFDWLLRAIFRERRTTRNDFDVDYRNPASPDVLTSPAPWDNSRTATPTASSSMTSMNIAAQAQAVSARLQQQSAVPAIPPNQIPSSPARARSTGDLLSEHEKSKNRDWLERDLPGSQSIVDFADTGVNTSGTSHGTPPTSDMQPDREDSREDLKEVKAKEPRPSQWASLDELLDKLLFLAVSGDDPAYITHFLLTYRRFATPRSVLLAMQKRMRQLDNPSGDPMFACFAQMRICHLLELWIRDYPHDFAVRGTAGALSALIKSIIAKTYLLHYGSDFLPFLELLPTLHDKDASWSLKVDESAEEFDDSYSILEDEDGITESESLKSMTPSPMSTRTKPSLSPLSSRERKSSLPLTAKALVMNNRTIDGNPTPSDCSDISSKQLLRDLLKVAQEVNALDSDEIAREITRLEAKLFLDIEPRHWLQYTLVSGKKDPQTDTIARFNEVSNHLADWVVSLILCHDRPKARARQIEKFVDIAQKLRMLNNYSALRAFVAGINNSTFPGDLTMDYFKTKAPEPAKNLQSWDILLQHIRSHRAYRMALKVTKGACIPALEVHMSDLIRAHEGNPDENAAEPSKIHWGKFNMIGKFISSTTQCQAQCRMTSDYDFRERPDIQDLILTECLMNDEMQKSRIAPPVDPDFFEESAYRSNTPRASSRDGPSMNQPKDGPLFRKFFPWKSNVSADYALKP